MLIISDIDSTLCYPCSERKVFIEQTPKNWKGFLNPDLVKLDTPIPEAQRCLEHFRQMGFDIVFVTGRNEGLRNVTEGWLAQHFNITTNTSNLFMRQIDDFRIPSEVKRDILSKLVYRQHPAHGWMAFDDDPYLMQVYRDFRAIPFLAPQCWTTMFDIRNDLPDEVNWRA